MDGRRRKKMQIKSLKTKLIVSMKGKIVGTFVVALFVLGLVVGCQQAQPPVLKEIGPVKTTAGVDFNIQPDGVSAMWAKAENATKTTVIVWGDKLIRTDYKSPDLLTAPVPKHLYAKPGQYQITLLDTKTNAKSNSLVFTVD
jgi:hypothetical protein